MHQCYIKKSEHFHFLPFNQEWTKIWILYFIIFVSSISSMFVIWVWICAFLETVLGMVPVSVLYVRVCMCIYAHLSVCLIGDCVWLSITFSNIKQNNHLLLAYVLMLMQTHMLPLKVHSFSGQGDQTLMIMGSRDDIAFHSLSFVVSSNFCIQSSFKATGKDGPNSQTILAQTWPLS